MLSEDISEDFGYKLDTTVSVFPDGIPLDELVLEPLSLVTINRQQELIAVSDSKTIKLALLHDLEEFGELPFTFDGSIISIAFDGTRLYVQAGTTLSYINMEDQLLQHLYDNVHSFKVGSELSYLTTSKELYLSRDDVPVLVGSNVSSYFKGYFTSKDSPSIKSFSGQEILVNFTNETLEDADIEDISDYSPIHISPSGKSFFVVYESSQSELDSPLVKSFIIDQSGNSSFTYIAEPFSSVERTINYYTESLNKWSDESTSHHFITSGLASEWSAVTSSTSPLEVTSIVPAEDSAKATFPLEDNGDDLSVVGTGLDLYQNVEVKQPCSGVDSFTGLPRLFSLFHDGNLYSWWIVEKRKMIDGKVSLERARESVIEAEDVPKLSQESLDFDLGSVSLGGSSFSQSGTSSTDSPIASLSGESSFGKPTNSDNPFATTTDSPFASSTDSPFAKLASTKPESSFGSSSAFGSAPTSAGPTSFSSKSVAFASDQSSTAAFGSTLFGKTSFGSSGFGGSTKVEGPKIASSFGSFAGGTSSMGGSKTNESVFGNSSPFGSSSESPFGKLASKGSESPFGEIKKASPFGSANKESPFGSANKESPFGSANKESPFGSSKESPFGKSAQTIPPLKESPFGNAQSTSAFGGSPFGNGQSSPLKEKPFGSSLVVPPLQESRFGSLGKSQGGSLFGNNLQKPAETKSSEKPLESPKPFGLGNLNKPPLNALTANVRNPSPLGNINPLNEPTEKPSPIGSFGKPASSQANASQFGKPAETDKPSPFGGLGNSSSTSGNPTFGKPSVGTEKPSLEIPLGKPKTFGFTKVFGENLPAGINPIVVEPSESESSEHEEVFYEKQETPVITNDGTSSSNRPTASSSTKPFTPTVTRATTPNPRAPPNSSNQAPEKTGSPTFNASAKVQSSADASDSESDAASDWSEIEAPTDEEFEDLQNIGIDEYEVALLQKNKFPSPEPFLQYDGLTEELENTDPLISQISSIYQDTTGLIKILQRNFTILEKLISAHLTIDESYTSLDTLQYPEKWRLSSLEDLFGFIDDLVPAVQYALEITTKHNKQVLESAVAVQLAKNFRVNIDRLFSQIEIYKNYSKLAHLRNRLLDVPSENSQRGLRRKLNDVKKKQEEIVKLMLPLKSRVLCNDDTVKGLEKAVYQINERVQRTVEDVKNLSNQVKEVRHEAPAMVQVVIVEKPNTKWEIGNKKREVNIKKVII